MAVRGAWRLVLLAGLVAACAPASPTASVVPASNAAADDDPCPGIDLRLPSGARLDLSGTWRGRGFGEYFVAQHRSCLTWMGRDPAFDDWPAGAGFTNVFVGRIRADFTVIGTYGDVPVFPGAANNYAQLTWRIQFSEVDGALVPALILLDSQPVTGYGDEAMVPEDALSPKSEFIGTYGFDTPSCPWLEVDGRRYELLAGYYVHSTGQIDLGPGVTRRPGDPLRAVAQVAPGMARTECQDSAMLVWELGPAQ